MRRWPKATKPTTAERPRETWVVINDLKVRRLGLGAEVGKRLVQAGGGVGPGFEDEGGYEPPPFEQVLKIGLGR